MFQNLIVDAEIHSIGFPRLDDAQRCQTRVVRRFEIEFLKTNELETEVNFSIFSYRMNGSIDGRCVEIRS